MRTLHEAKLVKIVDETTVDLHVELGFGVSTRVRLHLHGVEVPAESAPLSDTPGWQTAVDYIYDWFAGHTVVYVGTVLSKGEPEIFYGYLFSDTKMTSCLNDSLVDAGLLLPKSM